jgi:mannosyltransferase
VHAPRSRLRARVLRPEQCARANNDARWFGVLTKLWRYCEATRGNGATVTAVLEAPQQSAMPGPAPRASVPRRVRSALTLTICAEVVAAGALVYAVRRVDDPTLPGFVIVCALTILLARGVAGFLRGGPVGAATAALLGSLRLSVLVAAFVRSDDWRAVAALVAIGAAPLVLALAAELMPGLARGRRDPLVPGLVVAVIGAAVGVLGAVSLADLLAAGDGRVVALAPHFAAAMAALAISEVLADHHTSAGFAGSAVVLPGIGCLTAAGFLLVAGTPLLDDAVGAALGSAVITLVGFVVVTVFSSPRHLTIPAAEADGGPRFIALTLTGFTALACAVRLLAAMPLWLDDAALAPAARAPWSTLVELSQHSSTPPGVHLAGWLTQHALGSSVLAVRFPGVVAGVLLVPTLYLVGTELYDRRVGIIAAVIAAIGPGVVWLSATANAGAIAALLAAISLLGFARVLRRQRVRDWLLFTLSAVAVIWSHPFGVLHVAVLLVGAGWILHRQDHHSRVTTRMYLIASAACVAAVVALVVYRHGFGPSSIPPPLEYATAGAPKGGESLFGIAGAGVTALVGFHPSDVTSRLLALWPLCMLASFFLLGRRWSHCGVVLLALASAPAIALVGTLLAGAPRQPPYALIWFATAIPVVVIGVARAITLVSPRWRSARLFALVVAVVLLVAGADQALRSRPLEKFRIADVTEQIAREARPGDTIVYTPAAVGDLVRLDAPSGVDVVSLEHAPSAASTGRTVFLVAAFGLDSGRSTDSAVARVHDLSTTARTQERSPHEDIKVWIFKH